MRISLLWPCLLSLAGATTITKFANQHPHWQQGPRAPRETFVKLHIAVRQADDGAALVQRLLCASDPGSTAFRQHLDPETIADLSASAPQSLASVREWLEQHSLLQNASFSSGIYEVSTTIAKTEQLLNAAYHIYSDENLHETIRTESYTIPSDVARHVDFVTPTTTFPKSSSQKENDFSFNDQNLAEDDHLSTDTRRATCGANDQVTPTCIRQVYGITYQAKPNRTTFAVYGTEGASFSAKDTTAFLNQFNPPAAAASAQYTVIGNGVANESSGIGSAFETALDTQTLLGLAWPARGLIYLNGGVFGPTAGQVYDPFVQFLHQLATNTSVPSVVSFSESTPEDTLDPAYARRLCTMMAAVGARGTTLLFSSGDNGPNGDQPSGTHSKIFEPEFPASCPWVTAVGGTTNLADETAATQATIPFLSKISYTASGGGFSAVFPRPDYQSDLIPAYTASQIPVAYFANAPENGFNAAGRGIPDLSAFSTNVPATVAGFTVGIAGTSASTPLWAAIVTLLNDYEAAHGRPTLGFINPWLYSLAASKQGGLRDITTGGDSKGSCNFLAGCRLSTTLGFNVSQGWDPVTGLGSPVFAELLAALDARASE